MKDSNKDMTSVAAPATESCAEEDDTCEGLRYVLHESSSTTHQNSCCTNNGTSRVGVTGIETSESVSTESLITLEESTIECGSKEDSVRIQHETLVPDAEQENNAMTGNYGDIQELSGPVRENENNPMNGVQNEGIASLEMEFIEITVVDDEAFHVDAEQPTPQSSSLSNEEEKSSISTGEEEHSLIQSSFPAEEEYSQMSSSFSIEDDRIGEEENEDYSPKESSFSTEEEDSGLQSPISTEVEDENGENEAEMDEDSSEGTWSSSPEPNMEVIWPAEIMTFISSQPKEMSLSQLESEMKAIEDVKTGKAGTHHYLSKNMFDGRDNNSGKNNKVTNEIAGAAMDVQKQHAAKPQKWFWLGLVALVLTLLANCLLQSNYLSNNVSFIYPMK
ncbi:hypothetical protein HRI_003774600 [Hibiscus trionum]|uniref:Uncharacterized protein n=1 Tax=Hibiscus trionum TaxID=183268 RepID=A0A9W7ITL0_HIBTR|nr:hypothetical protein HRI_003774600 [Hibiscus trionum]